MSTAQPKASKAGRNLPMAIGVGLVAAAIVVACLLFWRPGFLIIIAVAVGASVWELRDTLAKARGIGLVRIPLLIGSVTTVVATWWWGHEAQALGLTLTGLVVLAWRFGKGAEGYLIDVAVTIFLLVYLAGFASFATLMLVPEDGNLRILVFLICVVSSDTGGYAAGVFLGKHPMAPTISPKKSWEGFAGSVAVAMTGGALSVSLMLGGHWWQGVILGGVLAVVATIGDLAESLIKRDIGVKDMGTLLPGHGGVMDRMDSLLPSAVVCWALLSLFVPVVV